MPIPPNRRTMVGDRGRDGGRTTRSDGHHARQGGPGRYPSARRTSIDRDAPVRRIGARLAVALLTFVVGHPWVASASPPAQTWAVIVENDSYGGRYPDLPAGYSNSTRMLDVLMERGWTADHIRLIRGDLRPGLLGRALGWLAERVRPGDTALLYVAGEYEFFARDLDWTHAMPGLWRHVQTPRRIFIVESCFAERLASAVRGVPGLALPAVGDDERDLWGGPGQGTLIEGGAFTYFLTRALAAQSRDAPLAFRQAFAEATAEAQEYFRTTVATSPAALNLFHAVGSFPERLAQFPNPHLVAGDTSADAAGD
jgi:hypothetical protein